MLVLCFFYFPQSIVGFFVYDFSVAFDFFIILIFCCFSYGVLFCCLESNIFSNLVNRRSRLRLNLGGVSFFVFAFYVLMIGYVSITSEQIAIFQAFQGASVTDLAESRERFLRTREGWEAMLPYLNAVWVMALLPYCIASLFYVKHRFRFYYVAVFLTCLSLTLEKSLAILAFLPLVVISFNGNRFRGGWGVLIVFVIFMAGVSFLARGGLQSEDNSIQSVNYAATMPDSYKIFDCDDQLCYLGNRVLWIPYATAIDWLRYQKSNLDGDFVFGASTGIGSYLLNVKKIELEKEIFDFQWGQNETGTGSSNVTYFVDAYVNFSWVGVFLYAFFVVLMVKIFHASDDVPLKAVSYVSLFYLSFNALPPMLTSGGLLVVLFICLFVKPRRIVS